MSLCQGAAEGTRSRTFQRGGKEEEGSQGIVQLLVAVAFGRYDLFEL